jgi:hypothetical protein
MVCPLVESLAVRERDVLVARVYVIDDVTLINLSLAREVEEVNAVLADRDVLALWPAVVTHVYGEPGGDPGPGRVYRLYAYVTGLTRWPVDEVDKP